MAEFSYQFNTPEKYQDVDPNIFEEKHIIPLE